MTKVKIKFVPVGTEMEVEPGTKILVAARRQKVPIRFGCGACRCGTCGVSIAVNGQVQPMADDEKALLTKMGLPTDGDVRLACRTKVLTGEVTVDLDFQDTYSPADYLYDEDSDPVVDEANPDE